MSRYIGPKCKYSRRFGTDLQHKSGIRPFESKCRQVPPGQHGQRHGSRSDYGAQLLMKQMIRVYYNVLESQLRRYYEEAAKRKGSTAEELLKILESRLDNVVYRMGFASTRAEARQLVSHCAVLVNGQCVNIPSYRVKPNDVIEIRDKSKSQLRIIAALELAGQKPACEWVEVDEKKKRGVVKTAPSSFPSEFNGKLVVEFYSK